MDLAFCCIHGTGLRVTCRHMAVSSSLLLLQLVTFSELIVATSKLPILLCTFCGLGAWGDLPHLWVKVRAQSRWKGAVQTHGSCLWCAKLEKLIETLSSVKVCHHGHLSPGLVTIGLHL